MNNEKQLDDLFTLQRSRTAHIQNEGINFSIVGGKIDNSVKGLIPPQNDSIIFFPPSTPLLPGSHIKSESGTEYLVRSATQQAGRVAADVVTLNAQFDTLSAHEIVNAGTQVKRVHYTISAVNIPCRRKGDELITSASQAPQPGQLIKMNSKFYEVQYVLNGASLSYTTIKLTAEPGAQKTALPKIYGAGPGVEFVSSWRVTGH